MHNLETKNNSIKVAFDITPLLGKKSGVGYTVESLNNIFSKSNKISLIPYVISFKAKKMLKKTPKLFPNNTKIFFMPAKILLKLWQKKKSKIKLLNLINLFEKRFFEDADIIHATNFIAPPVDKPTIINVWDCYFIKHPEKSNPTLNDYVKILKKRIADGCHIVTGSEHSKQDILLAFPEIEHSKVHSILLGYTPISSLKVEEGKFKIPKSWNFSNSQYVLFIGSTEQRKNVRTLIDAFKLLPKTLNLVIAGAPGNDEENLMNKIASLDEDIKNRIHRIGYVNEDQRYWLYKNAAVFCFPSYDEGFGIPVLEALQFGVGCALSQTGSLRELAQDFGKYFSPDDPEQIATSIKECLNDKSYIEKIKLQGNAHTLKFSWDQTLSKYEALYSKILSEKS